MNWVHAATQEVVTAAVGATAIQCGRQPLTWLGEMNNIGSKHGLEDLKEMEITVEGVDT
jgi:hypothetical protein